MNSNSEILHRLLIVASYFAFALVAIVGASYLMDYLRRRKEKRLMVSTAENILHQRGYDGRQRWIDEETMEFLYLVLGEGTKEGKHYVWAIVTVNRTDTIVTVRHLDLSTLHVNSHDMVKNCVADLAECLEKPGVTVKTEAVMEQPDLAMLHATD